VCREEPSRDGHSLPERAKKKIKIGEQIEEEDGHWRREVGRLQRSDQRVSLTSTNKGPQSELTRPWRLRDEPLIAC
jgi:hypothetical protein